MQKIDGRLDTNQYLGFLKQLSVSPGITTTRAVVHDFHLVKRGVKVTNWLHQQKSLRVLAWSRDSQDLMPVYAMYSEMINILNSFNINYIETVDDIWQLILQVWDVVNRECFISRHIFEASNVVF